MTNIVDLKNCDGCGTCADNCPLNVLEIKCEEATVVDMDMCTDSAICAEVCPKGLIERGHSGG